MCVFYSRASISQSLYHLAGAVCITGYIMYITMVDTSSPMSLCTTVSLLSFDITSFFKEVSRNVKTFQCDSIIIAVDFNFVFDIELDKITHVTAKDECFALMNMYNLVEVWRHRNHFTKKYTWSKFQCYSRDPL